MSKCMMSSATQFSAAPPPQAALMIVGNEVLNGSIVDANTPWLAKFLYTRGVDLCRVEVVPDDIEEIAETTLRLREKVAPSGGFVFTSGGIGPTADDMTYDAISKALSLQLELHQPTVALMKEHYDARGLELNESRLRMATLPTPSEVLVTPGLWVPLVVAAGNVYILPGIPRLFQSMIEANADRFSGPPIHQSVVYTDVGEGDIADSLSKVVAGCSKVRIGSYPNTDFDLNDLSKKLDYRVKLVVEGRDAEEVKSAAEKIVSEVPGTVLIR